MITLQRYLTLESTTGKKLAMARLYHYAVTLRKLDPFVRYATRKQGDIMVPEIHPNHILLDVMYRPGFLRRIKQLVQVQELTQDLDRGRAFHGPNAVASYRGRLGAGQIGDQWVLLDTAGRTESGYQVYFDVDPEAPVDVVGGLLHAGTVAKHLVTKTDTDTRAVVQAMLDAGLNV